MWRASAKDCLKRDELWWFFLHFSFASYNAWFNAALILPSENLEVTLQWKNNERLSLHFRVFFSESEGKREASKERQSRATGNEAEKFARVWRSSLALLLPSCLPEKDNACFAG